MVGVYEDRESKILEFKEKSPKYSSLIKTCVAFANGSGGEIILGIEDGTRKIIGLGNQEIDEILEGFPGALHEAVTPSLIPDVFARNIKGLSVAVVKIYPGMKKPYFVKSEGSKKGVYIRIGASTRQATDDYIEDLLREQSRIGFDHQTCEASTEALAPELLKQVYVKRMNQNFMVEEQILGHGHNGQVRPTRAALLMFSHNPDRYIPEALIICTHFKGDTGRDIIQTREIRGSIPEIVDIAVSLIGEWTERNFKLRGARLKGQAVIPQPAVREALVNALIHRKYSIPGAIKVAIYADHLEVFSPGAFPGLISLKNLGDGSTYLRNTLLAKFARKAGLVEKMGSGINLMISSCEKARLKRPEFSEDGDFVKVTFRFGKQVKVSSLDHEIEEMMRDLPVITVAEVLLHVDASRNTVTAAFNRLLKKGTIERVGTGRGLKYLKRR